MEVVQLENNLTVILKHVPNKVVTLDAWVNAGSRNEMDGNNGISHFLEHMMFKGTPRYGVGELDQKIMNLGGVWNAGTSKDFTHYYVTVAAPYFKEALDALADMMQHSLIDKQEFDKEKLVILEEYRRSQDNPYSVLYDELYRVSYENGPYRRTVLGSFESISQLDRDEMFDYYQRYYKPGNMALVIVGDIDQEACLALVKDAFTFQGHSNPLPNVPESTRFKSGIQHRFQKDLNEYYMALSWPAPPISNPDHVLAMDVLSTLAGDGTSSRLYRQVRENLQLVDTIGAGFPTHRHESLFYVIATTEREKVSPAIAATREVLNGLLQEAPSAEEVRKAKRILANGMKYGMETNSGQSGTIGYYFTMTGSTSFLDQYLDRLDMVTPASVLEVAREYLAGDPNQVILEPEANTPTETTH